MAKQRQYTRLMLMALLLGMGFAGLAYRLVDLQVLRHDELSIKAQRNTQREVLLEPRRGDILDTKGNLLATSVFVKTVCADPALMGNRHAEVAHALAPVLQLNENELRDRLMPRLRQTANGETTTNRYVVLKRKVPVETWQKVRAAMTNLTFAPDEKLLPKSDRAFYRDVRQKSVFVEPLDDQLRVYPNQALAAHVLGYVGMTNGSRVLETLGVDGIEKSFDSKLAGARGWRVMATDHQRRELVALREQDVEAHDGLNVVLTIDSVIQHIVESALAEGMEAHTPISITGIAIRPRTGEILGMATLPNFDPNNPGASTPDARRNRVIADVAEPGSTFKVVVVSGALRDGTVQLSDTFDCERGRFHFAGRVLHDHESYGVLTVEQIIKYSSNIGAAKVGIKMGPARLYDYIRSFGFGARTGIPLQGEVVGLVRPLKDWYKVSIAQIPMGQGIAVTRLQMLMAMCTIANKGALMAPMLVDRLEDREHNVVAKYSPQRVRQVLTEPAAKLMVQALKTVTLPDGTAPKAALEHYTVAGKTGTAQKFENGQLAHGKYFASFIGFFPADNPEICISVTLDEPKVKHGYYGGQIAAPIFKQIAERAANYLNIRPEDGEAPSVSDGSAQPIDTRAVKTAAARTPVTQQHQP
jgi:cell division protein FtsI/penicillin-binding protein 2